MNSAPFPLFTNPLGRLRPEGKYFFQKNSLLFFFYGFTFTYSSNPSLFFCIDAAVVRPHLDKFYLDRIDRVRSFSDRSFHSLVTFSRLATWGLGPIPTAENLVHEETTRRSKCCPLLFFFSFFFFNPKFVFFVIGIATMKENKEKAVTSGDEDVQVQDTTTPVVQKPSS